MPEGVESIQSFTRGQNGQLDPSVLNSAIAARLQNVTIRTGLATTRPALSGIEFPAQGRVQGLFEYRLEGADYLIAVVAGQVWQCAVATGVWSLRATFPTIDFDQAYFVQADQYAIIQNGVYEPVENWPVILHGADVVDNLDTQYLSEGVLVRVRDFAGNVGGASAARVPIGKAMAFGHGRLFVAVDRYYDDGAASGLPQGWKTNLGLRFWQAGNIRKVDNVQELLVFTDQYTLANGVAFGMPAEIGFITSMALLRNAETGTGLGALVVFCRRGAVAYAVSISRASWATQSFGQVLFTTSGTNSPNALLPVNSDLVYYSEDGLRTLKYSASSESGTGGLATVPLSPEVSNFTALTDRVAHAPYVTLAHADNYVFTTAGGVVLSDGSVAFRGILPWDLANFQVSGESPSRVFAGVWCGELYCALTTWRAGDKLAALYRESADGELKFGVFSGDNTTSVASVHTAGFVFGQPLRRKNINYIQAIFDRVIGDVQVWVKWRVDGSSTWEYSGVRSFTGLGGTTGLFRIPRVDAARGGGYLLQFAVEWRGQARMKLVVFNANIADMFKGGENVCAVVDVGGAAGDDDLFDCSQLPPTLEAVS